MEFLFVGYQVADKWLKDHMKQKLSLDDVIHYSNILYIVDKTIQLMKGIDLLSSKL
ncbi:MAG: hypothetical protein IJV27_09840 [Prevotella sp.]|nr:hypothetical protein [Prevotella sp.]